MQNRRSVYSLVAFLAILISVGTCFADDVFLKNGNRLSGTIVSMTDGKLILETDYAGKLAIDWQKVERVASEAPVTVLMDDGTVLKGAPQPGSSADRLVLSSETAGGAVSVQPARIKAINPPVEPAVKVNGQVNFGFLKTTGNTDKQNIHGAGEVVARTKVNRLTAGAAYNRAEDDGDKSEDNALGHLKYDHFLTEKLYWYLNGLVLTDDFKDINLRTTVGTGVGYQVFESEVMGLSFEAGPSYVNTDYDEADDEDYAAGRWAVKFHRFFFDKLFQYYLAHEGYISLSDTKDVFTLTRTGLRFPIRAGLFLSAGLEWDWDNMPADDAERSDYRYILSLGYGF